MGKKNAVQLLNQSERMVVLLRYQQMILTLPIVAGKNVRISKIFSLKLEFDAAAGNLHKAFKLILFLVN